MATFAGQQVVHKAMLFNSLDFAIFLPLVFLLYWFVFRSLRSQNLLLLVASYVFYGWWDWRFLGLILLSTAIDFVAAQQMERSLNTRVRKKWLLTSLVANLGLLGFFKYFNFFLENFKSAFSVFGIPIDSPALDIILPVGISFYTFQTLSYSIDVYRGELKPERNFIRFAAFVSFFPQLVAGPIERATNLLPQFAHNRKFQGQIASDGLRQILWGLFKKVVIADNCATYVNTIFSNYQDYPGSMLLLGAILFAFQIYGDFSGYSDMAIGTARLFGFSLMQNFAFPYFSRDIAEFWRRWHISLSTWFRDYVYIPLGGSRGSLANKIRNTFIIFLISGFWHGANWTFVVWGALNAVYFLPLLLSGANRRNLDVVAEQGGLPSARELIGMVSTFLLTTLAWIFFRAESIYHALNYIDHLLFINLLSFPPIALLSKLAVTLLLVVAFVLIEWWGRRGHFALERLGSWKSVPARWLAYSLVIALILMYMQTEETPFIYFQF